MKNIYVFAVLGVLVSTVHSMIKLVGPEAPPEDLSKPIGSEREISFERFKKYFDDGNTQFKVFDIARKYYTNKDSNITYQNFIQAGKEYLISQMADSRMSFQAIGTLITKIQGALTHYLNEDKNKTFTLEEFFRHSVQGQFKHLMKIGIQFHEQPWEVQQKLMKELEEKKEKNAHGRPHEYDHEEAYIKGYDKHTRDLETMRREEVRRRFQMKYSGVEWLDDGRRVIDEDYDEEKPKKKRNLHRYGFKRDSIPTETVDELLNMELDL